MRNSKYNFLKITLVFAISMIFSAISSASDTGELLDEGAISAQQIECTLFVPPFLTNGEQFTFQVYYSPLAPSYRTEKFHFIWPTKCVDLEEYTLRQKTFGVGRDIISAETAAAPEDPCIGGVGIAIVSVRTAVGPVCSAYALFNVQSE